MTVVMAVAAATDVLKPASPPPVATVKLTSTAGAPALALEKLLASVGASTVICEELMFRPAASPFAKARCAAGPKLAGATPDSVTLEATLQLRT